ncbi:Methyl-accepting chemotaxis protein [Poseidonocella pacifica]|uniref:Methyl-accepting chemotaxis protein n=1 Tax=Poseidonocella pacifica TaxID=871651 RepID=A0A1I0WR43_9RHOB|nr:methyl-accepting chemotaxis protein [Poseidonocella pacifica]SFA90630.1 Methyl-accepting chemotaxis protein [Poseidonocella pacifica]
MFGKIKDALGSIGLKVALSLMAMGAMTAAAIAIGFFMFQSLSSSLKTFEETLKTRVSTSVSVIEEAGNMRGSLSQLLLVQSPEELKQAVSTMQEDRSTLSTEVDRLPADAASQIHNLLSQFDNPLSEMHSALQEQFEARSTMNSMIAALGDMSTEASSQLTVLADDAYFDLSMGGEDTIASVSETFSSLVADDFPMLTKLLEARAEVNLLTGTSLVLTETKDEALASIVRDLRNSNFAELQESLDVLSQYESVIPYLDPLYEFLATLEDAGGQFMKSASERRTELLQLRQTTDAALSSAVDDVSFELIIHSEDTASSNESAIRTLLDVDVGRLRAASYMNVSLRSLVATSLLGASVTSLDGIDAAQRAISEAAVSLVDAQSKLELSEDFTNLISRITAVADPDNGIVAARARMLQAMENATTKSLAASANLNEIAETVSSFGTSAINGLVEEGAGLVAQSETAEAQMASVAVISLVIFLLALAATWWLILRPMSRVTGVTERLAAGDMAPVTGFDKTGGEIGRMAKALTIFRDGLIERAEMQKQEEQRRIEAFENEKREEEARRQREEAERLEEQRRIEEKAKAEAEEMRRREELRAATEAERAVRAAEQTTVVSELAASLSRLADGDLTCQIEVEFAEGYEELRSNFNAAVGTLSSLVSDLAGSITVVEDSASEVATASDNLSRRTEDVAATLEETSAALTELSSTASSTSERTSEADTIMQRTRSHAVSSSGVVQNAVSTMSEIESSSQAIAKIVDMIESIAFQTNLLALNAGVEAARAGEQGRGFAVVATEVRELAQRSSSAAKEINDLISATRGQIDRGVCEVGEAGDALRSIIEMITQISDELGAVATASREQSHTITAINDAMTQLEQSTQHNAAVCEETAAASQSLTEEARRLTELSGQFRTGKTSETKSEWRIAPEDQEEDAA